MVRLEEGDLDSSMTPYAFLRDNCSLPSFAEQTWNWSTRTRRLRIRLSATIAALKQAITAIPGSPPVKVRQQLSSTK